MTHDELLTGLQQLLRQLNGEVVAIVVDERAALRAALVRLRRVQELLARWEQSAVGSETEDWGSFLLTNARELRAALDDTESA